jgi:glycerol kinase
MQTDLGGKIGKLRVDGGAAANDLLMQFQADVTGVVIERPVELESTARGAAMLAGVGVGLFATPSDAARMAKADRTFAPAFDADQRARALSSWQAAVGRARST